MLLLLAVGRRNGVRRFLTRDRRRRAGLVREFVAAGLPRLLEAVAEGASGVVGLQGRLSVSIDSPRS